MAKQIKTEGELTAVQEPEVTTAETKTETVTKNEPKTEPKPEAYVLSVLQAFPNYEQLYVDKQGGRLCPGHTEAPARNGHPLQESLFHPTLTLKSEHPC